MNCEQSRYSTHESHVLNPLDRRLFTSDATSVVDDSHVDIVIELIGGESIAADLVERALQRGRHVITANKALLGNQGPRLQQLAALCRAARFEAAVGGAIPDSAHTDRCASGDEVLSIAGVVNGTCPSLLSAMEQGVVYRWALSEAKRLGYAEAGSEERHRRYRRRAQTCATLPNGVWSGGNFSSDSSGWHRRYYGS